MRLDCDAGRVQHVLLAGEWRGKWHWVIKLVVSYDPMAEKYVHLTETSKA